MTSGTRLLLISGGALIVGIALGVSAGLLYRIDPSLGLTAWVLAVVALAAYFRDLWRRTDK